MKKFALCISLISLFIFSSVFWHLFALEPLRKCREPRPQNFELIPVYDPNTIAIPPQYNRDATAPLIGYNSMMEVCESFNFVPSEWILTQTKEFRNESESSRCAALHEQIFETDEVKWVIRPNKTIENHGCTRDTPVCHPGAHFNAVRNIRINTPPCCRQKILFVFEILTKGLQQLNIPHVLFYGGVLGWSRNNQMIPYDEDLDMAINGTFWRSDEMMRFLENISEKHGFFVSWRGDKESFGVDYSKVNHNGVGVWSYRMVKDKVGVKHTTVKKENEWDYDVINPPKQVNFNGIQTYVPNKPVEYVDQMYGEGTWRWRELLCKNVQTNNKCIN